MSYFIRRGLQGDKKGAPASMVSQPHLALTQRQKYRQGTTIRYLNQGSFVANLGVGSGEPLCPKAYQIKVLINV